MTYLWVLLIYFSNNAPIAQVEFRTEAACLEGQRRWAKMSNVDTVCLFRGY